MIRGYAPHIWENKLESDKRRDTALLLAAELDDRKVASVRRLRCASSREISARPAAFGFGNSAILCPARRTFSFLFFKKVWRGVGNLSLKGSP